MALLNKITIFAKKIKMENLLMTIGLVLIPTGISAFCSAIITAVISLIKWLISLMSSISPPSFHFILITFLICFVVFLLLIILIFLNIRKNGGFRFGV